MAGRAGEDLAKGLDCLPQPALVGLAGPEVEPPVRVTPLPIRPAQGLHRGRQLADGLGQRPAKASARPRL